MSGNKSLKPPLCISKRGHDGAILLMNFEAWGETQGMEALFDANFKVTLPATDATVIRIVYDNEKNQDDTRKLNTLGLGALALVMETPQMINMIALECNPNMDFPSRKFPTLWKKIKKRFGTDDNVVIMDMDQDLCKIKLNEQEDPKTLLDDIAVVKVQKQMCAFEREKGSSCGTRGQI